MNAAIAWVSIALESVVPLSGLISIALTVGAFIFGFLIGGVLGWVWTKITIWLTGKIASSYFRSFSVAILFVTIQFTFLSLWSLFSGFVNVSLLTWLCMSFISLALLYLYKMDSLLLSFRRGTFLSMFGVLIPLLIYVTLRSWLLSPYMWSFATHNLTILLPILITSLIAFSEEIWFRGIAMSCFAKRQRWSSVIIIALWFGLVHICRYQDLGIVFSSFAIVRTISLGICFGALRWRSGSLWPGIILHLSINVLAELGQMSGVYFRGMTQGQLISTLLLSDIIIALYGVLLLLVPCAKIQR